MRTSVAVAVAVAVVALAIAPALAKERVLESGEACAFPVDFNGKQQYDCVSWNGEEWCTDATGLWGKCKPMSAEASASALVDSGVKINEVLARGSDDQEDFIELYNGGDEEVDLTDWTLFDTQKDASDKAKDDEEDEEDEEKTIFTFGDGEACASAATIGAKSTLLLTRGEDCSFGFGLGRKDTLTLKNAAGETVDFLKWKKDNALKGISFGRIPDGSGDFRRTEPTAGALNEGVSSDKLKAELPAGADVTNACCNKLKKSGFKTHLPVIVIDTNCQEVKDEPKIRTEFCTCSDEMDYNGYAGVEIRGSSSARDHAKKGMAVKLWNATNQDQEFPLLGLPKDEDWVMYGPETDRSIGLRNFLAYNISRSMGNYASRTKFVEVFLKDDCNLRNRGESRLTMADYHGVYLLEEKIKRHKKRVDVCKHDGTKDITGGYIFKHDNDNIDKGDVVFPIKKNFNSREKLPMVMIYPKGVKEDLEREVTFLEEYLNGFEMVLKSDRFADPSTGYAKYIDVDSFIDYFLGTEITKNPDAYRGSTYMHKDCNGLVAMGPMWDYNEAFGMCCGYPIEGYMSAGVSGPGQSGGSAISTNGWRFNICEDYGRCKRDPVDGISHWYVRLWQDPQFRKKAAERWAELRRDGGPLSNAQINANLEEATNYLRPAAIRNYNRWKADIGSRSFRSVADQWEHEAKTLREWVIEHMEWMDKELARYKFYTHQAG